MRIKKSILGFFLFLIFFISSSYCQNKNDFVIDKSFYSVIKNVNPIIRDDFCEKLLGKNFEAEGIIKSVKAKARYRRYLKVEVIDKFYKNNKVKIVYNLYLNKNDFPIIEGAKIKFKAKMMVYIPLDSLRKNYIFEAVFIDGTIKIE